MPIGTNNWNIETYKNQTYSVSQFLRTVRTNVKIIIKVSLFFLLKASFLFKMKGYHNRSFFDSLFCGYELDSSMNLPKAANFKVKTELMSLGLALVSCHLVCTWLNIALMRAQCSRPASYITLCIVSYFLGSMFQFITFYK